MENKKIFAQNLKLYMDRTGKSRRQICEDLGFSYFTFTDWVNAKKYPRIDKIEMLADYFGVQKSDLIEFKSVSTPAAPNILPLPQTHKIPLLGEIACGEPITAEENVEAIISIPDSVHADFALRCKGDSMIGARIMDGDLVYIRQQPDVDDGEIAAVLIGGEATLKRVYKMPGRLQLRAENPSFAPINLEGDELEDVRILGKAVAFTSPVR